LTHKKREGKHDLTDTELQKLQNLDVPDQIDWRQKGAVTPIKNQGQCGSCYTFGAIGAIEGQWFRKTNKLIAFSEEEVLDCGDDQCGGGI
jgi:cathepsin L